MAATDPVALSRNELYDLIWSVPIIRLNEWIGTDYGGMDWILRRANIPKPPKGHWRKVENGFKTKQIPLPEPERADDSAIEISKERHEKIMEEIARGGKFERFLEEPDWLRFEKDPANRIVVPAELTDPHPLVQRTENALRTAKKGSDGRLVLGRRKTLLIRVTRENVDRALRIMDTLVKALEARGMDPQPSDKADEPSTLVVEGSRINFGIEEVCRLPDVPNKFAVTSSMPMVPTGILSLKLYEYHNYWRKQWADGKVQRVETCLNKFIVELHYFVESEKAAAERSHEQARVYEEKEAKRKELIRLQQEEKARLEKLERDVVLWEKSESIRRFIKAYRLNAEAKGLPTAPDSEAGKWIEWATSTAARFDPLLESPPSILDDKVDWYYWERL